MTHSMVPGGTPEHIDPRQRSVAPSIGDVWRDLARATEIPAFVVDRAGVVVDATPAARALVEACGGASLEDCFRSAEVSEPMRSAARLLRDFSSDNDCSLCVSTEDRREPSSWNVAIRAATTPDTGYRLVTIRDISTMVRLEQTARRNEALAAMGTMLADVAHEVRNPLFAIAATLDAFEARFGTEDEYCPYITVWRSEIDRLTALMQNLLEYGKNRHIDLVSMSPEHALRAAVHGCAAQAASAGVSFEIDVPRGLPDMSVDASSIGQLFQNLVSNAVQHSQRGAKIELSAGCVAGENSCCIEVLVRDHGAGIAESDLQRIFHPFFSKRRDGTGIGLSIVQRIVERHGGTVTASNHPEGGAVFSVRLPAAMCELNIGRQRSP